MTEDIQQRVADDILELTLARPAKKNALTAAMYEAMTRALAAAGDDDSVGAVLFSGEGDGFCAGNDINDFLKPGGAEAAMRFIRAISRFAKPMVAAVHGQAVGVGTTMLLHCDLVYASPDARFSTPFAKLGLVPEAASSLLLPQRIGMARASAMLLLGEPLGAREAEAAGLVTAVVDGALHDHAREKARALAAMPPRALAASRALMRGDGQAIAQRLDAEEATFADALVGAEAKEAFTAFLEKRAPVFARAPLSGQGT
ncbi:enoyl-CoA hydratase [Sphingomonas sp.]|uniref:enoyl-CoA hydratase n=1 Tax=Sphingomonas sp. TaxID=28214 RepID=UPI003B006DAB